jgi:hypothetical protein
MTVENISFLQLSGILHEDVEITVWDSVLSLSHELTHSWVNS